MYATYRVMVVEDEIFALKSICKIIEKYCPQYRVFAACENASEAMDLIVEDTPDIILSDIRMPGMTGLELAEWVYREYPTVQVIIISGYQDFTYAQRAIRARVLDYILKPVVPSKVCQTLENAKVRLMEIQQNKVNALLKQIVYGKPVKEEDINNYISCDGYYGAVIRQGALPGRFFEKKREIFSDIHDHYLIFGRDESEEMLLIPEEYVDGSKDFKELVKERAYKEFGDREFITAVYSKKAIQRNELITAIPDLFSKLDSLITIGKNQILSMIECQKKIQSFDEGKNYLPDVSGLEILIRSGKKREAKEYIRRQFFIWQKAELPQLTVEMLTRTIFLRSDWLGENKKFFREKEVCFDEAFYYAKSMEDLADSLLDLQFFEEEKEVKNSAEAIFLKIVAYLEMHIASHVSLQDICKKFGLSQTYVSKIFRTYAGLSFNQYRTDQKMQMAQRLFKENPNYYVKDVAFMVGYEDQFYFSRIFRSYTGKSPSVFIKENEEEVK